MTACQAPIGSGNTQLLLPAPATFYLQSIAVNPELSKPVLQLIAIDDASASEVGGLGLVSKYVSAAIADSTRRAYRQDLQDFLNWGGSIPATPEIVAAYVAERAQTQTVATLTRRVVGIGRAHVSQGLPDTTKSDLVRTVLRGVRRVNGAAQRRVNPLVKRELLEMVACMDGLRGARDRALLLIGFSAALRRCELAALQVEDIEMVREGLVINIRRSKTDQDALGRKIAIPWGRQSVCPVQALNQWLDASKITNGPIFRAINRADHVADQQLSAQSIALIIKGYARQVGLDQAKFSGHSLRAGFVTSAIQAGVAVHKIQQQTGHKSVEMLSRYIRDASLFDGNASGAIL